MTDQIITLVMYCIPALVVGAVAFYFFRIHIENEDRKRMLTGSHHAEYLRVSCITFAVFSFLSLRK